MSPMVNLISSVVSLVGNVEPGKDKANALHDLSHQLQELRLNLMDRGSTHVLAVSIGANNGVNGHGRAQLAYGA